MKGARFPVSRQQTSLARGTAAPPEATNRVGRLLAGKLHLVLPCKRMASHPPTPIIATNHPDDLLP